MKKAFLIAGLIYITISVQAQKKFAFERPNSFQMELFGHGFIYSLNYERVLINRPGTKVAVQIGAGYYPKQHGIIPLWIPLVTTAIIPIGKSTQFEAGIGTVFTHELQQPTVSLIDNTNISYFLTARTGIRIQRNGYPWLFRIAFTPFIEYYNRGFRAIYPSGGASFGYTF